MGDSRLFFGHTVSAMFVEAFPPAAHAGLVERFASLGLDVKRPLLPAYEYATWRNCIRAQRELALINVSDVDAAWQQGARYVESYFDRTMLGGPLKMLLRAIGTRRTLDRMAQNFRSGNNFSEVKLTMNGERHGTLWVNDIFHDSPEYIRGMMTRGLALTGSTIRLELQKHEGDSATFEVRWD